MSEARMMLALVTQEELEQIAEHRREIIWRQSQLKSLEENVKALLDVGARVQPGRFTAKLVYRRFHAAAWKQAVIANLGDLFAERFRLAAPLATTTRLEVTEHPGPQPLSLFDGSA